MMAVRRVARGVVGYDVGGGRRDVRRSRKTDIGLRKVEQEDGGWRVGRACLDEWGAELTRWRGCRYQVMREDGEERTCLRERERVT